MYMYIYMYMYFQVPRGLHMIFWACGDTCAVPPKFSRCFKTQPKLYNIYMYIYYYRNIHIHIYIYMYV